MTILLVSGATATLRTLPLTAPVGHLVTPAGGNRIEAILATGRPWAVDNGCGPRQDGTPGAFDEAAFVALIDRIAVLCGRLGRRQRPLWVACPDVVGDWRATRAQFQRWNAELLKRHLEAAYVIQDGQPRADLPSLTRCFFLGGSTEYKEYGHWGGPGRIHIGRVNSERRLRLFDGIGFDVDGYPLQVDSVDGTQFSMFPDRYIPRWCERLRPGSAPVAATELPMFAEVV